MHRSHVRPATECVAVLEVDAMPALRSGATRFPREVVPRALGPRMAIERKARGLTQKMLAEAIGASRETVYRFEGGLRPPSSRVLFAIAKALDLELSEIWSGWPEPSDVDLPCLGPRVRHRRRAMGLTLAAAARAAGVSTATFSRFECEAALPVMIVGFRSSGRGDVRLCIVDDGLAVALGFPDAGGLDDYCAAADLTDDPRLVPAAVAPRPTRKIP